MSALQRRAFELASDVTAHNRWLSKLVLRNTAWSTSRSPADFEQIQLLFASEGWLKECILDTQRRVGRLVSVVAEPSGVRAVLEQCLRDRGTYSSDTVLAATALAFPDLSCHQVAEGVGQLRVSPLPPTQSCTHRGLIPSLLPCAHTICSECAKPLKAAIAQPDVFNSAGRDWHRCPVLGCCDDGFCSAEFLLLQAPWIPSRWIGRNQLREFGLSERDLLPNKVRVVFVNCVDVAESAIVCAACCCNRATLGVSDGRHQGRQIGDCVLDPSRVHRICPVLETRAKPPPQL
jgi:hypothetical protein